MMTNNRSRRLVTPIDRARARLMGQVKPLPTRKRMVRVTVQVSSGYLSQRYSRTFAVPAHKDPDSNVIRAALVGEAIESARKANSALGPDLRVTLVDYAI